jgi:hypothetical protein
MAPSQLRSATCEQRPPVPRGFQAESSRLKSAMACTTSLAAAACIAARPGWRHAAIADSTSKSKPVFSVAAVLGLLADTPRTSRCRLRFAAARSGVPSTAGSMRRTASASASPTSAAPRRRRRWCAPASAGRSSQRSPRELAAPGRLDLRLLDPPLFRDLVLVWRADRATRPVIDAALAVFSSHAGDQGAAGSLPAF